MYSSDEDEVPVVYLNEESGGFMDSPPPPLASTRRKRHSMPATKRKSRSKKDPMMMRMESSSSKQHHRQSVSRRKPTPGPLRTPPPGLTGAYAAEAAAASKHHHRGGSTSQQRQRRHSSGLQKINTPSMNNEDIPTAFKVGGGIIDKAKSIFQPPPQSQHSHRPSVANHSKQQRQPEINNDSWQSFGPAAAARKPPFVSNSDGSTPVGMFDNFNPMEGIDPNMGFTDPPPPALHEFPLEDEKEPKGDNDKKKSASKDHQQPPKSLITTLKEIHPAIYFSTILAGLLIVRQREDIEGYLHEGIGVLFTTINALTILITVLGAGAFCFNFIAKRTKEFREAQKRHAEQQQQQEAAAAAAHKDKKDDGMNYKTLEDLMDYQHFNDDFKFGNGFNQPPPSQQVNNNFGPPLYDDGFYNASTSPPLIYQQFKQSHHQGPPSAQAGRSFSIPAVLNPKPIRLSNAHQYPRKPSPTSVPIFDPNQFAKHTQNSYFPENAGLGVGFESPSPPHLPTPSFGFKEHRPTPILSNYDKHSPLAMPSLPIGMSGNGINPMPKFEEFGSPKPPSPPSIEIEHEQRNKDDPKTFLNPKRVIFRRREQTPVIQEEPEVDGAMKIDDSKNKTYVDDFSCKPWGPPPRRYHGVNV